MTHIHIPTLVANTIEHDIATAYTQVYENEIIVHYHLINPVLDGSILNCPQNAEWIYNILNNISK